MTDNEIMSIEKAMFILRHGSAEGEHKYFEAIEIIEKEYHRQKAEIEKLEEELKSSVAFYKTAAIKEFAERLTSKVVNTPFIVNCSGETDEYKEGCLRGLVAKQHNILDMIKNLVKEMVG